MTDCSIRVLLLYQGILILKRGITPRSLAGGGFSPAAFHHLFAMPMLSCVMPIYYNTCFSWHAPQSLSAATNNYLKECQAQEEFQEKYRWRTWRSGQIDFKATDSWISTIILNLRNFWRLYCSATGSYGSEADKKNCQILKIFCPSKHFFIFRGFRNLLECYFFKHKIYRSTWFLTNSFLFRTTSYT